MPGPEIVEVQTLLNLVRNGGFEDWRLGAPPYWTLAGSGAAVAPDTAVYFVGARSLILTRASVDAVLTQNAIGQSLGILGVRGKPFTLSAQVWPISGSAKAIIGIDDGVGQTWSGYATHASGWSKLSLTHMVSLAATKLEVSLKLKDAEGLVRFDACMFTQGSASPAFCPNPADFLDPQNVDTSAPATPTGLAAVGGPLTITLTWTASPELDVDTYEIQRSTNAGFTTGLSTWRVSGTKYADIPGSSAAQFYRVRAVRRSGSVSAWSAGVTATAGGGSATQVLRGDGTWGAIPAPQISSGWTVTPGYVPDQTFDPETTTILEMARVLGSLIDAFKAAGYLGD